MSEFHTNANPEIQFAVEDWVFDTANPGQPGQFTGEWRKTGPFIMVNLRYPGGGTMSRPLNALRSMPKRRGSVLDAMRGGHFGTAGDLRRLVTFEKLKGTLHEVIYSMEAAQIDFYPYQFKPVMKFINSPTERLIIADEVGLGKTIESALVWTELQARRQAKRMLVVCPKILSDKWREELRSKFLLDARVVDFRDLQSEIAELKTSGAGHSFVLVATYSGLRPPKKELRLLKEAPESDTDGGLKTRFLRELRHWHHGFDPFDLVVFDEAHYMRNPATTIFHMGEALSASAGAVLCVSATPVNNKNADLHSLLRLVDESFFETQGLFDELLEANRPAVQAGNSLARVPVDMAVLGTSIEAMGESRYIREVPLFKLFKKLVSNLDTTDKAAVAKCQDIAEKLNLLGHYINRTRRVQVAENRPLRDPLVRPVTYAPQEMELYRAILKIVRKKCQLDKRAFHVFQVIGLQLRAASCLPAVAEEIRNGKFGDANDLFGEAFGEEASTDDSGDFFDEELLEEDAAFDRFAFEWLLATDFEAIDSKYQELRLLLTKVVPEEKVVIFAYYRPTLAYLRRRLMADGISTATIHGGVEHEMRWREIERFKDPSGPRVLLSSEVGSEGIDLQFCRVLVNYDLPWNPMRVEQRIGRIDRVGQLAKRLSIVNFKVKDTIEERLFDRLHMRLALFANSLGDLEAVIGQEVKNLTVELLSKELTHAQEAQMIANSERVLENRLVQIQHLEEGGDALVALADYVQKKITEDREKGRYILPDEVEEYLIDFFEREYQGTEVMQNTPADGCIRIRLSHAAQASLADFIKDDRTLAARPLRQREFTLCFRKDVLQKLAPQVRKGVHFANHLSPLVRWMTKINQDRAHSFFNVSAVILESAELPEGEYCFRIERWKQLGLNKRERLAYGVVRLDSPESVFNPIDSEKVVQNLLRYGTSWDYANCDTEQLLKAHDAVQNRLAEDFDASLVDFDAENETAHQIRVQRVRNIFEKRIAQDGQRLQTLRDANRNPSLIKATEGRIERAKETRDERLADLDRKKKIDFSQDTIAAGIVRVIQPPSTR